MLESWCWEPAALARMSGHVDDNSKPLPEALVKTLVAAKNANANKPSPANAAKNTSGK